MKNKILFFVHIFCAALLLTGCLGGGGGGGGGDSGGAKISYFGESLTSNTDNTELPGNILTDNVDLPGGDDLGINVEITDNEIPGNFEGGDEEGGDATDQHSNPEPASLILLGSGVAGLVLSRKKRHTTHDTRHT